MKTDLLLTELQYKAVRSSGAGGQNVNKVSSKVVLTFDLNASHVIPAMIRKFHEAKANKLEEIILWAKEANRIKRLEIKVQARNERALHLYQKMAFETEGIIRRGFLSEDNEYLDIVLMSYLL